MRYELSLKEYDQIEKFIDSLSKFYKIKQEKVDRLFIELLNNDYIQSKQDLSLQEIKDCLETMCIKKKEQLRTVKSVKHSKKESYQRYIYTYDYIVNFGLYQIFGDDCVDYLNPLYIEMNDIEKINEMPKENIHNKGYGQKIIQLQYDGIIKE